MDELQAYLSRNMLGYANKINWGEKVPSHVPYLLSKSDFGPSSVKPGIEVPQLSNPFIFGPLAVLEGGFHMI
jgi:hypothetical protein